MIAAITQQGRIYMEYRKLPHGSENISILGMGTSSIGASGEKEIRETLRLALENGINYNALSNAGEKSSGLYFLQSLQPALPVPC